MNRLTLADGCYGAALLTMPLVGVGLIHLTTGVDLGAGLQPAYLFLALAWLLRLGDLCTPHGADDRTWLKGSPLVRSGTIWLLICGGVVLLSGLGLVIAPAPLLAGEAWPRFGRQVVQLAIMAAFLIYPALWTRGPDRWRWTERLLAWSVGLQIALAGVLALHQIWPLPGLDLLERGLTSNPAILAGSDRLYLGGYTAMPRLRGAMCEPLYLGSFLVGFLPLLAVMGRPRLAIVGAVALILTWSRAAWLAAGVGLVVWYILQRRAGLAIPSRRWFWGGAGVLAGGAVLVVAVAGVEALTWPVQRLAQTFDRGDWSNLTRFYSFQAAWRAFLESPLVGVGWGQFPYHFYALVDLPGLDSQFTWPVVNSIPLLLLCETGLVGLAVAVALSTTVGRNTWRILARAAGSLPGARLAALAAGGCGVGVQLLFFSQYNLPHLWVLPGLWLAALAEEATNGKMKP